MQRGEVWWAALPEPIGTRPVLLLSRDRAYQVRRSITVALITTTVRSIPVEVPLGPEDGMPRTCVVNCDELHTVARSVLTDRLTGLSGEKIVAVGAAVRFAVVLEG